MRATEAAAAALRHQQEEEEQNARPFRFIDLPLELQEMVYSFYAADVERRYKPPRQFIAKYITPAPPRRQLANLQIPALAHVCHEVRVAFLPIFFKEGKFTIVIGPYDPPLRPPRSFWTRQWTSEALLNRKQKAQDQNDPILLSRHMSTLLSPTMVVRNVRISCHDLIYPLLNDNTHPRKRRGGWYRTLSGRERLALVLKWEDSQLETLELPKYVDVLGKVETFPHSTSVAQNVCGREEFKGFTVEDLRWIASVMLANDGRVGGQ